MTKRSLDEARQFGRSLQPTHDLQAEAGAADGQSTFAILDVNEVQADAQPKKITLQGVANVVAPLLPPASIAAAGSNTQIQFNDSGYLGGDAGLTFNKTTDALTAGSFIPSSSTVPTNGVYLPSANNVAISTGSTGRLFIDSSGRVGIGTTAPGELLSLSQDVTTEANLLSLSGTSFADGEKIFATFKRGAVNLARVGAEASSAGAAGSLIFETAISSTSTERARIDSSGRLLVGTSSARSNLGGGAQSARLQIEGTTGDTARISQIQNANSSNAIQYIFAKSRGTTVGSNTIVQSGDGIGQLSFEGSDGTNFVQAASITGAVDGTPGANVMPGRLVFSTTADGASSPTERMRINAAGGFKWSDNATYTSATDAKAEFRQSTNVEGLSVRSTNASFTSSVLLIRADRNVSGGEYSFITAGVAGVDNRFIVANSGNVTNTNNSYGAISDVKLKENIVDANSQWDDLKALQVRNYNFKKGQTHTQIGLVAQEVELVSPGLVSESPDLDEEGNDLGTVTKSVNYSVLYMKAVKALQEAMERIETLEAKVNALEGN